MWLWSSSTSIIEYRDLSDSAHLIIATGAGAAALGDPVAAVAWLANTLSERGTFLDEGHIVLSGAITATIPVHPGDCFRAGFGGLGALSCRFI
jgi:2-keto-4-pentenoate hydratase